VNNDIQRYAGMVTTTTASGDNDDAVEPDVPYDSRLLEFQKTPTLGGTVRVGLKMGEVCCL
jgi:hypothetical protein